MRVAELWRYPVKSFRGVRQVRGRCVMTTFELDGVTALDCYVLGPGRVAVGDTAEVLGYWTLPRSA